MTVRIIQGDCRDVLKTLESESVDCVVSSPPYWGLRDYGVAGAIGLEPTLAEHIATLVDIFREVRRVLKSTGTCWVNYGDAYACAPNGRSAAATKAAGNDDRTFRDKPLNTVGGSLKPKDRMMLPARLAIALQDDGWWLRDEIIWAKPNPMPSSVKDRTTPAHEMIYLLTKSPRYFYDAEAIREDWTSGRDDMRSKGVRTGLAYLQSGVKVPSNSEKPDKQRGHGRRHAGFNDRWDALSKEEQQAGGRNKRSVWTVATQPYSEAHFATFPPDLIEPCIKAGCPTKVCSACGAPWMRIVERGEPLREWQQACGGDTKGQYEGQAVKDYAGAKAQNASDVKRRILEGMRERITIGFRPTCKCDATTAPGLVLDPFGGAGTTGLVADRLQRNAILVELNAEYVGMARARIDSDRGGLLDAMENRQGEPTDDRPTLTGERSRAYPTDNSRAGAVRCRSLRDDRCGQLKRLGEGEGKEAGWWNIAVPFQ